MSASKTIPRYRPSLTAIHIAHIVSVLSSEVPLSEDSKDVLKVLRPFLTKIELDAIVPAFTAGERLSITDRLGDDNFSSQFLIDKKQCYNLWRQGIELSPRELEAAKDYAYANDLLTASEEQDYEAEMVAMEDRIRKEI